MLACIGGSAVNQDGATAGLTVPSARAQRAVVLDALASAGVAPRDVGYVEAHGTGTKLGDPIELAALADVFAGDGASPPPFVGSVKANVGHTEAAAGIVGLLKCALCVQRGVIVGQPHFRRLNERAPRTRSGARANRHRANASTNAASSAQSAAAASSPATTNAQRRFESARNARGVAADTATTIGWRSHGAAAAAGGASRGAS